MKRIKEALQKAGHYLFEHPVYECIIFSVVLNLILESLSRHSVISALRFLCVSLPFFLAGAVIIALTESIALFFRRRYFVYMLVTAVWLTFGITQAVLMGIRAEPFAAVDFVILLSAFRLIPLYIGTAGIILVIFAFAAAGLLSFAVFRKAPAVRVPLKKSAALSAALAVLTVSLFAATVLSDKVNLTYKDAPEAYEKYGFAYCFVRSFADNGVDEPEEYSREAVERLVGKLPSEEDTAPVVDRRDANVIFLQLESFIDPKYFKDLGLESDPVPNFTAMKNGGPSGLLHVNTVGGGTANTEFQVLCGMNLNHFGIVEYPYSTILDENTAPSLATVFSKLGYGTCALHNHTATFYSRNKVYANLGFDTFVPVEYMQDVEYNGIGWEKDSVLTGEIMKALGATDGADFVFAVSVEGHGNYPDYEISETKFKVENERYADIKYQLEYYVNTVNSMDAFLGELTAALSELDEPTVLVVYGDHMPSLDIGAEDVTLPDLYNTEYAVWSNCGLWDGDDGDRDLDLESYSLSSRVLSLLGVRGNTVNRLHTERGSLPSFQRELQLLEYDVLYGESYCEEKSKPHMTFGTERITVEDVRFMPVTGTLFRKGVLVVRGENFTPFSCVFADGVKKDTTYVDENTLMCSGVSPGNKTEITVVQLSDKLTRLGSSDIFVFGG